MSAPERFHFTSSDGLSIACVKWVRPQKVRGVIQIAHGLGEHMGRYEQLAEILLEAEFAVYGDDHRGHGLTAKQSLPEVLVNSGPAVSINSSKTWFRLGSSQRTNIRASHTSC